MLRELLLFIALVLSLYFLALGNLGLVILLLIFVTLLAIIKKEEYQQEKKKEEAKAKIEETLDNRYPEVFYSSSVLLSDPKWAPAVKFGDAFMLDLLHHLMFKVREIDKGIQTGEIAGPEKGGFYGSSKPEEKPFTEFAKNLIESYRSPVTRLVDRGEPKEEDSKKSNENRQTKQDNQTTQTSSSDQRNSEKKEKESSNTSQSSSNEQPGGNS
jgi:Ca2+/Na+ antiporter